jgi:hypothetical protein
VCIEALQTPEFVQVAGILGAQGYQSRDVIQLVAAVTDDPASHHPVARIAPLVAKAGFSDDLRLLERYVLLTAAVEALGRLPALPVSEDVKALFCEAFRSYAAAPGESAGRFAAGTASFAGMCKTATLRRFPAGQFEWEVSGISRSDLLAVGARHLLPTLLFVARRMRGRGPVFFSHLNWRRGSRSLLESEANRSYYRMAQALRLQPAIKGFAACSWFRSPATQRVSPHLAWLSRVFLENGGFVVEAGADSPESGVLHRSATRRRLYEAGEFRPTKGLVMWPRDAMIAWAETHPELATIE